MSDEWLWVGVGLKNVNSEGERGLKAGWRWVWWSQGATYGLQACQEADVSF